VETYSKKAPPTFATTAYLQPYCDSKEKKFAPWRLLTREDSAVDQ
jgi:hypothetical protein